MGKSKLRSTISNLQNIDSHPGLLFFYLVHFFHTLVRFMGLGAYSKYFRFLEISTISFKRYTDNSKSASSIEVLFVTTAKDFQILRSAIKFANRATSHHESVTFIILVPDHEAELCASLLSDIDLKITVLKESGFISESVRKRIRDKFSSRAGWVLQQILKDLYVLSSNASGVLIVDSDTLLLEKRNWLSDSGKQVLLPTWEYHAPYYRFLSARSICSSWPKFTFVSHHMMMQPKILLEAFNAAGWTDLNDLVDSLMEVDSSAEESPFCIEYELYGQYILTHYPELVSLEKWSNTSFTRSSVDEVQLEQQVLELFGSRFASVSLHSYLN